MSPELLARLEEAFQRERCSFVRYVVESSQAEVRDDFDRRVLALYRDWSWESAHNAREMAALLAESEIHLADAAYPLEYSQFNFLSPGYLLAHVIAIMGEHLEALEAIRSELASWSRAEALLRAIVERGRVYLEKARRLEAERPAEPAKPPAIKGTSASRW